ncbi:MAG: MFS transporter [Chloroflexi bacterium]|nr:MFS transporter [Chloroflexota bacterium]MYE39792.1 MFS transporter [Chloroflexota bacterium]
MAGMTLAAHLAAGLNLFALSPLLPLAIEEYGISHWAAGLLVSLPMLVGAAIGIPGGILIARVGVKRAYMWAWVCMALLAIAPIVPNFYVLLFLRLAYGVGLALMVVATGPLVMQWFKPREMLVVNSLNTAILSGGVAASLAGAVPLAELLGWKMTLTVFSGIGIVGTILWPFAPRDRDTGAERRTGISVREVFSVLRGRAVALLVAADAGIFIQYTALTTWLPTFYAEERGISAQEAGIITSILPFVGIFAVLAGGAIPLLFESFRAKLAIFGGLGDFLFSYRGILAFSGILAILGGLGAFLLDTQAGIYIAVVVLGIGSWFYVPALLTIPMRLSGATPERVAAVWGSYMTFSGLGMFIFPILVGWLYDNFNSYYPGFIICAVASWSLLICGVFLPRDAASENAGVESRNLSD